jgi:ABC-type multidrug transport system fused ATPase/permease subunit
VYGWLWRHTPGPWWSKILLFALVVAALVAFCFEVFFPWVTPLLPLNQVTVEEGSWPAVTSITALSDGGQGFA